MQWSKAQYGGFSEAEPWLPMSDKFREEITVEAQQKDDMDGQKHQIRLSEEWSGYKVLLENYEDRKMMPAEDTYIMEPYELMVLGN